MAALTLVGAGCGGDNGTPPANEDPIAAFTFNCNALACTFTNGSTDPDGAADIESWSWDFGGDGDSDVQSPTHTFSAANTYQVALTVTDAAGATNTVTQPVTVTTTPNTEPVADFDFICNSLECTFTDASTDADGTIASWNWAFDDGSADDQTQNPVHTYPDAPLTTYNVTLTVTDDDGATNAVTKDVAVAPPAGTVCEDGLGDFVPCTLDIEADAVVTVTITSRDCTADGNTLLITAPIQATVFDDGCTEPIGPPGYILNGGTAFTAGTPLEVQMVSGSNDPDRIAPAIRVTGTYPDWVLEFDDGEDPTGPGEPDFDDIVLAVHAEETP